MCEIFTARPIPPGTNGEVDLLVAAVHEESIFERLIPGATLEIREGSQRMGALRIVASRA